jgi:hypothetical protein
MRGGLIRTVVKVPGSGLLCKTDLCDCWVGAVGGVPCVGWGFACACPRRTLYRWLKSVGIANGRGASSTTACCLGAKRLGSGRGEPGGEVIGGLCLVQLRSSLSNLVKRACIPSWGLLTERSSRSGLSETGGGVDQLGFCLMPIGLAPRACMVAKSNRLRCILRRGTKVGENCTGFQQGALTALRQPRGSRTTGAWVCGHVRGPQSGFGLCVSPDSEKGEVHSLKRIRWIFQSRVLCIRVGNGLGGGGW